MKADILIFDSETTGLPPKGAKYFSHFWQFPHVVQLAWYFNGEYQDYIIKPDGYRIPEEATAVHGITTEMAQEKGVPFITAVTHFLNDCDEARKLIGHNIYFDSSIIKANILKLRITAPDFHELTERALHKDKRLCTMMKTIKFVGARQANNSGKFATLEELYFKLFGESFPAHNALEDVKATKRVALKLHELNIIDL